MTEQARKAEDIYDSAERFITFTCKIINLSVAGFHFLSSRVLSEEPVKSIKESAKLRTMLRKI